MLFLFAHSLDRFLITFLRCDYAQLQRVGWMAQSQIIAPLLLAVGVIWLAAYDRTRGRKRERPPEPSDDLSPLRLGRGSRGEMPPPGNCSQSD